MVKNTSQREDGVDLNAPHGGTSRDRPVSKRTEFSLSMRNKRAGAAREDETFLARPNPQRRERGQRNQFSLSSRSQA